MLPKASGAIGEIARGHGGKFEMPLCLSIICLVTQRPSAVPIVPLVVKNDSKRQARNPSSHFRFGNSKASKAPKTIRIKIVC